MGKEMYSLLLLPVACFFYAGGQLVGVVRDPCSQFTELGNVSSRSPDFPGYPVVVNDDINLARGWYAAPAGWKLLSNDPGSWKTCGTKYPIYRTAVHSTTGVEICIRIGADPCSMRKTIQTRMCGKREIYELHTTVPQSAFCFECPGRKMDILIISDVSRSIGPSTFEKMKQVQHSLVTSIDISQDTNAVALMGFSGTPRVLLTLDSPSSVKEAVVQSMIKRQQYENGPSTDLADALDMAVTEVFTAQKGDRADADNMVILFTDGWLYKSEKEDVTAAIAQLSAKAEVFVVASKGVNSVVQEIASKPKDAHIFHLDGEVTKIKEKIIPCH